MNELRVPKVVPCRCTVPPVPRAPSGFPSTSSGRRPVIPVRDGRGHARTLPIDGTERLKSFKVSASTPAVLRGLAGNERTDIPTDPPLTLSSSVLLRGEPQSRSIDGATPGPTGVHDVETVAAVRRQSLGRLKVVGSTGHSAVLAAGADEQRCRDGGPPSWRKCRVGGSAVAFVGSCVVSSIWGRGGRQCPGQRRLEPVTCRVNETRIQGAAAVSGYRATCLDEGSHDDRSRRFRVSPCECSRMGDVPIGPG